MWEKILGIEATELERGGEGVNDCEGTNHWISVYKPPAPSSSSIPSSSARAESSPVSNSARLRKAAGFYVAVVLIPTLVGLQ